MSGVTERVKTIIVGQLGVNEAMVVENASFINDLGADSLDAVELVMTLEGKFGSEIPDDDAREFLTIKDVVDFIEAEISKYPSPRSWGVNAGAKKYHRGGVKLVHLMWSGIRCCGLSR